MIVLPLLLALIGLAPDRVPFAIRAVDEATGRGVPLVELRTVDAARFVTDNAGLVAFDEPGLMGVEVYFHVKSHGYEYPADGFGNRGVRLRTVPGAEATIKLKRINIAERLYRITGGGLYRDSLILGRPTPLAQPAINGLVLGQDSVVNGVLNGTLYWFWGDTNRPSYPLGNFHVPGATSKLPAQGGLDPDVGIDLTYFVGPDGFARPTAQLPGSGPTWIFGVVVLPGKDGRERMLGSYVKIRGMLDIYEHGAVEFDEKEKRWFKRATWPEGAPIYPSGQPTVDGGWVYFANDLPNTRVRADVASYLDLTKYEALTPLKPGSRRDNPEVESRRDVLRWKRDAPPLRADDQARLIRSGQLQPADAPLVLRDVETGRSIRPHTSSLAWNAYRKAWSLIVLETGGTSSLLGEVWYAEADHPAGPWVYARKVVTHDKYSFYNPRLHPYFFKDGGRLIYFEGTYTQTFSGSHDQTPRYDYNQIMYRLDLSDSRLNLPLPVVGHGLNPETANFYAPRRPGPGLIAGSGHPLFYVLDPNAKVFLAASVPLIEYEAEGGRRVYEVSPDLEKPGLRKTGRTIGRVWPSPNVRPL